MRILFVNTSDIVGGAAIAAMRLHEGLQQNHKTQDYFIVADKSSSYENVFASRGKLEKKIEGAIDLITSKFGLLYQFSIFSGPNIIKIAKEPKPNIIHLHNLHGGYFAIKDLEPLADIAPLVWTLHDMWSFTGNAAHTFGNESWRELKNNKELTNIYPTIGINTGSFLLKQKRNIYQKVKIKIVTPSKWLQNLARQSPVFNYDSEIVHINNGINLSLFKKNNKYQIRKKLNIPVEAKVLMFVAELITHNNPWKGGSQLIEIIKGINDKTSDKIHIIIIGKGNINAEAYPNFQIHNIGYITDSEKMVEYFNATDVFIYPTYADNLPNVLVEAIACGTPCVCNEVGGCNEIIIDNYNGFIIKKGVKEFIEKTLLLLHSNDLEIMSFNGVKHALNFDINLTSSKYFNLYTSLIKNIMN